MVKYTYQNLPSAFFGAFSFNPGNTLGGFSVCPILHSRTTSKPNMAFSEILHFSSQGPNK